MIDVVWWTTLGANFVAITANGLLLWRLSRQLQRLRSLSVETANLLRRYDELTHQKD